MRWGLSEEEIVKAVVVQNKLWRISKSPEFGSWLKQQDIHMSVKIARLRGNYGTMLEEYFFGHLYKMPASLESGDRYCQSSMRSFQVKVSIIDPLFKKFANFNRIQSWENVDFYFL